MGIENKEKYFERSIQTPIGVLITEKLTSKEKIVFGIIFSRGNTEYLSVKEIHRRSRSGSRNHTRRCLNKLKTLGLVSERKVKIGGIEVSDFHPLWPRWIAEEEKEFMTTFTLTQDRINSSSNR